MFPVIYKSLSLLHKRVKWTLAWIPPQLFFHATLFSPFLLPSFRSEGLSMTVGWRDQSKSCIRRIADHHQRAAKVTLASDYRVLAAAPEFVQRHNLSAAYLFISLTVNPDKTKAGENAALQLPWSMEVSKGKKVRVPPTLCRSSWISNPSLYSFTSHLRSSAWVEKLSEI